jgi:alpha-glucosidase (family GH31 glycosyl hydrolase)
MSVIPSHLQVKFSPVARPEAVVSGPNVRFTVLAARLLRLEYSPTGTFEDRPSQVFWYRDQPVPAFDYESNGQQIVIETADLRLHYTISDRGFAPDTLAITLKASGAVWHYGDADPANLRGTARTLDNVDGHTPLAPGLMSRAGWSVVDDSRTLVFDDESWLVPRAAQAGALDLYFFGYGHAYQDCLRDYCRVAGRVPLLPRWALGNWWSRYWSYSEDELLGLMDDFKAHDIPLSVCIVDIDWHIRQTGNHSRGWTGYTWNRDLFPDPTRFVRALHARGLKTALNLHPHEGVHPHEAQYIEMAQRVGIDPASGEPVPFDIANPAFAAPYFEVLHHPEEQRGIDFWWMDWQQGELSLLPGLDPLWWLNHLHFYDLGRNGAHRPFVFSRWGGLGNHRYPIGFSGDTLVTWESLAFQPYFTATAANVNYGWWSHDIGGHYGGVEDPELYTRWVQFGVFSPIMRLHSTDNPFLDRRPWGSGNAAVLRVARDAMQLRHALIPYLYTLSWQNATGDVPPIRPMYYDYPEDEAAYWCPQQYLFGSQLIAAPFMSPIDPDTRLARQVIWLPQGDWIDFASGEYYAGGGWHAVYGRLEDIPLFAKAGAILPLGPKVGWGGIDNPAALDVHIFAGADGRFVLYEDDGNTLAYRDGARTLTEFAHHWQSDHLDVVMGAAQGDAASLPERRTVRLYVHGVADPALISAQIGADDVTCTTRYDADKETLIVEPLDVPVRAGLRLTLSQPQASLLARRNRTREKAVAMLRDFRLITGMKYTLLKHIDDLIADPAALGNFKIDLADSQVRALLELLCEAGEHAVYNTWAPEQVMFWNNRECAGLRYAASTTSPIWLHSYRGDVAVENGDLPRFKTFAPNAGVETNHQRWEARVQYFDFFSVAYRKV